MNKFDSIVTGALDIAQAHALKKKNSELDALHLAYGLISNPSSFSARALKKYKKEIETKIEALPTVGNVSMDSLRPSAKFSEWLTLASGHVAQSGRQEVTEKDLLKFMPQVLTNVSIDYNNLSLDAENEEEEVC